MEVGRRRHRLLQLSLALNILLGTILLGVAALHVGLPQEVRWRLGMAAADQFVPGDAYEAVRARWAMSRLGPRDLVLIGDSHVDAADWDELLGRPTANRGIGGDTTLGVLHRLRDIRETGAEVAVILLGHNDAASNRPADDALVSYRSILDGLLDQEGIRRVVVLSTIHTSEDHRRHDAIRDTVERVNAGLAATAEGDARITFVDLNARLAPGGSLLERFQLDTAHLSAEGYAVVVEELDPVLADLLGPIDPQR